MFGEGIGISDLFQLLNAVREKDLILEVKILDKPWETLTSAALIAMVVAIKRGDVQKGADIRLRLHSKESPTENAKVSP